MKILDIDVIISNISKIGGASILKVKNRMFLSIIFIIFVSFMVNPMTSFAGATSPTEINVKTFGAVGDGVADDTQAIQNVINSAIDYEHIYIPAGKYKVSQLDINTKSNLSISGEGTLIKDSNSNVYATLYIHSSNHIKIEDLNMIGNNAGTADRGVWATDNYDLHVQNVHFSNFSQQALILWGGTTPESINHIQDNYITNSGYGIQLMTNAEYYAITQNTITSCTYGIQGGLGNDRIDNNQINNNVYGIWLDGSLQTNADHSSIANNQINHNRAIGLYLANVHLSESIIDNEILSTVGPEVWSVTGYNYSLVIINCTNAVFTSNQIDGGNDGSIYVNGSSGVRYIGNTFHGNLNEVSASGKNVYMGNVFTDGKKLLLNPGTPIPVRIGDMENGNYIN